MKKLKKSLTISLSVLLMLCMGMSLVGCKNEMKTSTDGTFKFFRLGDNQLKCFGSQKDEKI